MGWSENGVFHAVEKFFVFRAEGDEDSGEEDGVVGLDKVVRADPGASVHGDEGLAVRIPVGVSEGGGFVEALQDAGLSGEFGKGLGDGGGPLFVADIGSHEDAAGAPGLWGVTGDFENEVAFAAGELADLFPGVGVESREDGGGRQGGGFDDPALGDDLAEVAIVTVAELASPEVAQGRKPEQGQPEFFFEEGFERGGQGVSGIESGAQGWAGFPFKGFKEAVGRG